MNKIIIKGVFILIAAISIFVLMNVVFMQQLGQYPLSKALYWTAWDFSSFVIIIICFAKDIISRKYFNNKSLLLSSVIIISTWFYMYFIAPDPFIGACLPILQIIAYIFIRIYWPPSRKQSN